MARYVVLLCALFFSAVLTQDPCYLPQTSRDLGYWSGPVSNLKACFTNIPYNSVRNSATIAQLRYMADLYSFNDIVNQTLSPWNINVDLNAGLTSILTGSYSNDYSFHVAISNLLNRLEDAHTRYALPEPYRNGFVLRPFGLRIINENGNMKFMTTEPIIAGASEFSSIVNFNPSLYYNKEVTSIDGETPLAWLKTYANNYCHGYKDEKVRFNAALTPLGCFVAFDGSLNSIENAPASHSMVIGGQTLTVPNMAILFDGLSSTQQAVALLTTPKTSKRSVRESNSLAMPDIHREHRQRLDPLVNKNMEHRAKMAHVDYSALDTKRGMKVDVKRGAQVDPQVLAVKTTSLSKMDFSVTTSDYTAWRGLLTTAGGNNIPVLRVESFYPDDSDEFVLLIDDFANQLARNKFDAAIIDVSNNGGGYICLANYLLAALVEDFTGSKVYGKYDLRISPANDQLVQAQVLLGTDYLKLGTTTRYAAADTTWYNARQSSRNVSQLVHYPAECKEVFAVASPARKFFAKNLVVVTDGTCGSACAMFVAQMEQSGKVKIVTHGGTTESPAMTTGSFAGGNVLDWPSLVSSARLNGVTTPNYLPTSALLTFSHHEMYLSNEDVPLEFLFSPAQFHTYYWDAITDGDINTDAGALTRANLYETASQAFGSIVQKSLASQVANSALLVMFAVALII